MSLIKLLSSHRYAALCIAVIIGITAYASATNIAHADKKEHGAPCTTQIANLDPSDFVDAAGNTVPIVFTINYQNPGFDQDAEYTNNTASNPPLPHEGHIVTVDDNAGNLESITFQGAVLRYNDPAQLFTLPNSGRAVSVRAYSYSGRQYAEIIGQ